MTEAEARVQAGTNRFMDYVAESRTREGYEPYWLYSERQRPSSEFNRKSLSDYIWNKWGIK